MVVIVGCLLRWDDIYIYNIYVMMVIVAALRHINIRHTTTTPTVHRHIAFINHHHHWVSPVVTGLINTRYNTLPSPVIYQATRHSFFTQVRIPHVTNNSEQFHRYHHHYRYHQGHIHNVAYRPLLDSQYRPPRQCQHQPTASVTHRHRTRAAPPSALGGGGAGGGGGGGGS